MPDACNQVLLGVACTALREHTRLPAVIAGAVVLHTGYSMVWALMGASVHAARARAKGGVRRVAST